MGIREIRIATERKREKDTMGADFNVLYIKV